MDHEVFLNRTISDDEDARREEDELELLETVDLELTHELCLWLERSERGFELELVDELELVARDPAGRWSERSLRAVRETNSSKRGRAEP